MFYDGLNETDAFGKEINEILNDPFDSIISKLHAVLEVINDFADEACWRFNRNILSRFQKVF